jgi:hypothetical protein
MIQSPKQQGPAAYLLRVDGHLDQHWSSWFGDLTLTREGGGTTSLTGVVADQAELHGLLTGSETSGSPGSVWRWSTLPTVLDPSPSR